MSSNNDSHPTLGHELRNVPGPLWIAIPVLMVITFVLPGGYGGCIHGLRWIFGFPWPNWELCQFMDPWKWVWHPVAVGFNLIFWFVFLTVLAILSPHAAKRFGGNNSWLFCGVVLALAVFYVLVYRVHAVLCIESLF